MSKVIDVPADSSPATETFSGDVGEGFAEFQAEQRAAKNASAQDEEIPLAEAAPASERETTPKQEEKAPLTDEQKSAAKTANNDRRWDALLRERAELKAENERLKAPKADIAAPATAAKTAVPEDPADPKPKQTDFTDFDDYVDARSTWNARQVIKQDRERQATETAQKTARTHAETFMGKMGEYAKTHPGFIGTEEEPGAFEIVRDGLEESLPVVSAAIVEHERSEELIDYLGTHPEALDRITALKGNPAKALIELGKIVASEFEPAPVAETKPQRKPLPKPPASVSGRGHHTSTESALDAAADNDDFAAAQKIFAQQRKADRG